MNASHRTVVFRRWKDGGVIALFPEWVCEPSGNCVTYEHFCGPGMTYYQYAMRRTRSAKAGERRSLQQELEARGYVLDVRKRRRGRAEAKRASREYYAGNE